MLLSIQYHQVGCNGPSDAVTPKIATTMGPSSAIYKHEYHLHITHFCKRPEILQKILRTATQKTSLSISSDQQ
jgi:hypothetical protein